MKDIIHELGEVFEDFGGTLALDCYNNNLHKCYWDTTFYYGSHGEQLIGTESLLLVSAVAKKFSLGKVVARYSKGDDNKYYLAVGIQPGVEEGVDGMLQEFYIENNRGDIFARIYSTHPAVYFDPDVLTMFRPKQPYIPKTKYYVVSYEPDMLFEIFNVVNKIRQNGSLAFYDEEYMDWEEVRDKLELELDDWIIVSIDRQLYSEGRCHTYRISYGREQMEGSRYISSVGCIRLM